MKKIYENVIIKVSLFNSTDIVRTSDPYEGEIDWNVFDED